MREVSNVRSRVREKRSEGRKKEGNDGGWGKSNLEE
jgi:hypothetical protein